LGRVRFVGRNYDPFIVWSVFRYDSVERTPFAPAEQETAGIGLVGGVRLDDFCTFQHSFDVSHADIPLEHSPQGVCAESDFTGYIRIPYPAPLTDWACVCAW
jgi:hypothetical protein